MDDEDEVRRRIIALMAMRGIAGLPELATHSGLSYNSLNSFMKGKTGYLQAGSLQLIAESLQVTRSVLSGDESLPPMAPQSITMSVEVDGNTYDTLVALAAVERSDVRVIAGRQLKLSAAAHAADEEVAQMRSQIAQARIARRQKVSDAVKQWEDDLNPPPA